MSTIGAVSRRRALASNLAVASSVPALAWAAYVLPLDALWVLLGAAVAGGVAVLAVRHPVAALGVILATLPFLEPLQSYAVARGIPFDAVRLTGASRDLALLGLVALAARTRLARRPDRPVHLVFWFLALTAVYLVGPLVVRPVVGELFPRSPSSVFARLHAARLIVMPVAAFLALRLLPLRIRHRRWLGGVLLAVTALVAVTAVVSFLQPHPWARFGNRVLGLRDFRALASTDVAPFVQYAYVFGQEHLRSQSILFDPIQTSFFMVPGLALSLTWPRGMLTRIALPGLLGAGIVLTLTRSAVLAAVVVVLVLVSSSGGRRRAPAAGVLVALGAIVLLSGPTGLDDRAVGTAQGVEGSTIDHLESMGEGTAALLRHPLGQGIGYSPVIGTRFGTASITTENSYLQLGNELGLFAPLLYLALIVATSRMLRRSDSELAPAGRATLLGIAVGAMFLPVWTMMVVAVPTWMLAGLGCGRISAEGRG